MRLSAAPRRLARASPPPSVRGCRTGARLHPPRHPTPGPASHGPGADWARCNVSARPAQAHPCVRLAPRVFCTFPTASHPTTTTPTHTSSIFMHLRRVGPFGPSPLPPWATRTPGGPAPGEQPPLCRPCFADWTGAGHTRCPAPPLDLTLHLRARSLSPGMCDPSRATCNCSTLLGARHGGER